MGLTERYVCILNFWENPLFCFVSCLFGNVLDDFQNKLHANVLAFLQGLYLVSSAFKDYTKSLIIVLGLEKKQCCGKKQIGAKEAI